ncbi:MAG: hypothetical protein MUF59_05015 [Candidatus Krumholzibacteria bacterium]|nr:hypothetical protein [Candidatus Krumholzibacteria bacterium]
MRIKTTAAIVLLLMTSAIASCKQSEDKDMEIETSARVDNAETAAVSRKQTAQTGAEEGIVAVALQRAAEANKHVFVLFFNADDEPTRLTRKSVEKIVGGMGAVAEWIEVDVKNGGEADIVNKYNLRSSPMPIVLVFAPNGALTGGFRSADISDNNLKNAIASRAKQDVMKALQERKVVLICCQGKKTKFNKEAMKGVEDFKADMRYSAYTTVVRIDPADDSEKVFLAQLKIEPNAKDAATALLVPPNMVLGVTNGPTSKESLLNMLASASSSCGSGGCGPSGCAPDKSVKK